MRIVLMILLALSPSFAFGAVREFTLTASQISWTTAPGRIVTAYAYNASIPGPELRVREGDTVRVTLINALPEATTIHWHGVPVPNAMDGVPGVTSPGVAAGGRFTYEFTAPAAGTYWYHPHANSAAQIARGLYGALIVEPEKPEYDRDFTLIVGEMGGMTMGGGMGMGGGMNGGMMNADNLLINGKTGTAIPALRIRLGERVLFRFINSGNMLHPMHLHGMHWTVTATDGFDLDVRYRKDTLPVAPGERYDALLVANSKGTWMLHCHNLDHTGRNESGLMMRVVVE